MRDRPADMIRKFPTNFTVVAAPIASPKSNTPWACPMASSIGRTRSFAAVGPAEAIHSILATAASGRPKIGASTKWRTALIDVEGSEPFRTLGRNRRHRDVDAAGSESLQKPVFCDHGFHRRIIPKKAHDNAGGGHCVRSPLGPFGALRHQGVCL